MHSLTKLVAPNPSRPNKARKLVWVETPCCQVECCQRLSLTLMAKAMSSLEPSKNILDCVASHRKDGNLDSPCCENIKSDGTMVICQYQNIQNKDRKRDMNMILRCK